MHNNPYRQGERDGKRGLPRNNKIVLTEIAQKAYDQGYAKGLKQQQTKESGHGQRHTPGNP